MTTAWQVSMPSDLLKVMIWSPYLRNCDQDTQTLQKNHNFFFQKKGKNWDETTLWSVPKTGFFVFLVRGPNYLDHEIWSGPQIWSDEKNVLPNIVRWTISGRNLSENRVRLRTEFASQKLVQRTPKKRKVRFWERSTAVCRGCTVYRNFNRPPDWELVGFIRIINSGDIMALYPDWAGICIVLGRIFPYPGV